MVDYGTINLGELSSTAVNQLGQKNINLTINCTAATKLSWNLIDERSSSNAKLTVENATALGNSLDDERVTYGVGKAGNVNIGSYGMFVKVDSVTADGEGVTTISADYYDTGVKWAKGSGGITAGSFRDFSVAAFGSETPIAFKTATFPLVTSLAIQNTSTLAITDDTALDGELTISLRYL